MLSCSKHIKTVHAKATCQQLCERNQVNATTYRSRNQCTTYIKLQTEFIKRGSPRDKHITPKACLFSHTRILSDKFFVVSSSINSLSAVPSLEGISQASTTFLHFY